MIEAHPHLVPKKVKIALYTLTCCEGCALNTAIALASLSSPYIKVESFRLVDGGKPAKADIALVEGAVITLMDKELLRQAESNSKVIVALGSCSHNAGVLALKNMFNHEEALETVYGEERPTIPHLSRAAPVTSIAKVDYIIPGCPPSIEEIESYLTSIILGKGVEEYEKPVCWECRLKDSDCLLKQGILCLGPIVKGGCKARCPEYGKPCLGCRGLVKDAKIEEFFESLKENNISKNELREAAKLYLSMEVNL